MAKKRWISVHKKLPKMGKAVLILTFYGKVATAKLSDCKKPTYGWVDWMRSVHSYGSVVAWMKIPKIPKIYKMEKG
jgi:hypothetical protein